MERKREFKRERDSKREQERSCKRELEQERPLGIKALEAGLFFFVLKAEREREGEREKSRRLCY